MLALEVLGWCEGIVVGLIEISQGSCDVTGLQRVIVFFHVEKDQLGGCLKIAFIILELCRKFRRNCFL